MAEHINKLDIDKDNTIEVNELLDALKPWWFLSKEENIKIVATELKTLLKNAPISQTLLDSFEKILQDFSMQYDWKKWDVIYTTYQKLWGEKKFLNTMQPPLPSINKILHWSNSILISEQQKHLSLQFIQFDEKYSKASLDKIYNWVKNNDPNFSQKEAVIRKRFPEPWQEDYVKREVLSYALEQYWALLEQKIKSVAFNAGYKNWNQEDQENEIKNDQQLYEAFQRTISQFAAKNHRYEAVVQKVEIQQKRIDASMKKYGLTQEKITSITQAYSLEQQKLATNPTLKAAIQRINTVDFAMINQESIKHYFADVKYVQEQSKSKVLWMQEVQKFYADIKQYKLTVNEQQVYTTYINTMNSWFSDPMRNALANAPIYNPNKTPEELRYQRNLEKKLNPNGVKKMWTQERIQRYNTYMNAYVRESIHILTRDYEWLQKSIMWLYTNPENQNYLFKIKYDKQKVLEKQKGVDAIHVILKQSNPMLYQAGNLARGVWEGWWRGIWWIYKWLKTWYHMIAWTDKDNIKYDMQHIDQTANWFSWEQFQATSLNKSLVTSGNLTMSIDNTTNQVWQQIANMIMLLSWWWAAGKWFQALGVWAKLAPKLGLMTNAMGMQVGNYFDNAIQLWLNPKDAFWYALVQWWVSAGLELISPNSAFLGNFKIATWSLFAKANKQFVVQYMKNIWKEVWQEIIQEETQLLAEKWLNHIFNAGYNKNIFDTQLSFAEIYSTAILTGITTGIVSSKWKYNETKINQQTDAYIQFLQKNPAIKIQQVWYIDKLIVQHTTNTALVDFYRNVKIKLEYWWQSKLKNNESINYDAIYDVERYKYIYDYNPDFINPTIDETEKWFLMYIRNKQEAVFKEFRKKEDALFKKYGHDLAYYKALRVPIHQQYLKHSNSIRAKVYEKSWLPLDFKNPVGRWSYGQVFRFINEPSKLIKIWIIPKYETIDDIKKIIEAWKRLNNPRLWLLTEVIELWNWYYAQIMPDVSENHISQSLPDLSHEEAALQLYKDAQVLKKEGILLDRKVSTNFIRTSKWYSIIDVNTIPNNIRNKGDYYYLKETNQPDVPLIELVSQHTWVDLKKYIKTLQDENKNIKSATFNDWSFSSETAKFNDYFWKESRFWFDSKQAIDNSTFMDQFTVPASSEQLIQIRNKIQSVAKLYTDKTGKTLELTDEQIQTIIAAHLKPGELGKLTQAELRAKVELLATTIPDADVRRFLLEAGFCGMKEFAVKAVLWIKSRKERRTPMRAVLALNALIMLNSVDNAKTKILHKSIDVTQHMCASLEKQSHDIQSVEQWFTKKIEQSKEQFDEMVETYKSFLTKVKEYNDTRLGRWLNRMSNGVIDETIAKAEEWKYALENTQNIVWDVNSMMQEIKTRTDASLKIAENMKSALNNAHDITDLTLNILQIISLITLLYQVFYAYWLYHSKEWKAKEQQVMMKNMKIGIVASAISLLAFYGKINPEMQSWAIEVTQQLQTLDDMIQTK